MILQKFFTKIIIYKLVKSLKTKSYKIQNLSKIEFENFASLCCWYLLLPNKLYIIQKLHIRGFQNGAVHIYSPNSLGDIH